MCVAECVVGACVGTGGMPPKEADAGARSSVPGGVWQQRLPLDAMVSLHLEHCISGAGASCDHQGCKARALAMLHSTPLGLHLNRQPARHRTQLACISQQSARHHGWFTRCHDWCAAWRLFTGTSAGSEGLARSLPLCCFAGAYRRATCIHAEAWLALEAAPAGLAGRTVAPAGGGLGAGSKRRPWSG